MKNLKLLRETRDLSQQKLADEFHLSQQSIYKYENNLAEPDFETLKKMADFFHTTVDYLMGYPSSTEDSLSITGSGCSEYQPLSAAEAHHLYLYRNLDSTMQKHIDAILESLSIKGNRL